MDEADGHFDERAAATYEESFSPMFESDIVQPAVAFLADLADGGAALELGIGTGRIALPLAARGVRVRGINLSRAMVTRMRAKSGGDAIDVTIGDLASTTVASSFTVAYLVFNTIMNLTTQAAQVACFRNVAAHLEPGGCFVIDGPRPAEGQSAVGGPRPCRPRPGRLGTSRHRDRPARTPCSREWVGPRQHARSRDHACDDAQRLPLGLRVHLRRLSQAPF